MTDKRITQAFEQMGPSPEAEDRMLANILAAAEAPENTPQATAILEAASERTVEESSKGVTSSPETSTVIQMPSMPNTQTNQRSSSYKPSRKVSPWKVALPVAACLVLLAGIGIFALTNLGNSANTMVNMSMEAATGGSASDSAAPESAAPSGEDDSEAAPKASDPEALSDTAPVPEAEESADAGSAATLPNDYPYIEFTESGGETWFMVCFDDQGEAQQPDSKWVGKSLGAATAYSADLSESIPCTIYECPTTAIPYYIVQYEGDPTYYLALGTEKP